jgi:flagellar basal body-associated protein FliL
MRFEPEPPSDKETAVLLIVAVVMLAIVIAIAVIALT